MSKSPDAPLTPISATQGAEIQDGIRVALARTHTPTGPRAQGGEAVMASASGDATAVPASPASPIGSSEDHAHGSPSPATGLAAEPDLAEVPPDAAIPALHAGAILGLTLLAALGLAGLRSYGIDAAGTLATDAALAERAVNWTVTSGAIWLGACTVGTWTSTTAIPRAPHEVLMLARAGMTLDSAFRHATESVQQLAQHGRTLGTRAANFQVLLGMMLTAGWLALHAEVFVIASDAVAGTQSAGMGDLVAGLLQLGPKAFITTATALGTALVLSTLGTMTSAIAVRSAPETASLLAAWRSGNPQHRAHSASEAQGRTAEMVARALSVDQVKELQSTFRASMDSVAGLLGGMASSMKDLRSTAGLMSKSYAKLELVAKALEKSQLNVDKVAQNMETLSTKVEGYGTGLLRGTEAFTERLVQDTSTRIPEVVNAATSEAVRGLEPHIRSLTNQMHKHLQDSADAIQQQYTQSFNETLRRANDRLLHVNAMTEALEQRTTQLAQALQESNATWAESTANAVTMARMLADAGKSTESSGAQTAAAAAALTRAAQDASNMMSQLDRLVREARAEVESLRRDAELLGQIREAVQAGGGP